MSGTVKSEQAKEEEDTHKENNMASNEGSSLKLLTCFAGIFISYFVYGLLQETITKGKYGDKGDKFTYTLALVCFQCIFNAVFAQIILRFTNPPRDTSPQKLYAAMSFSYVGAMVASFAALQFINYPTQVLGKSVKPIPVMILGVIVAQKRYPLRKYLFVLMIVMGVALFTYKDKKSDPSKEDNTFGVGGLLLVISLALDGMTGGIQDKIRAEYTTQTHRMMFFLNAWSVLYLAVGMTVTGEGFHFIVFAMKYPHVLLNMMVFSCCSAVGQHFIFLTVTSFGPLMCSIITTTRKFFTILCSVLIFGHPMVGRQWVGTSFVFAGLVLDNLYGKEKKVHK